MRIYLDSCVIIYLVEGRQPFERRVAARLAQLRIGTTPLVLTSRLSRLECRTRPLREGNTALLADYETFFAPADLRLIEISAAVVERATDLRARYGFKTPDALHLATAIEERADLFLTGDGALARCAEIQVEVLVPDDKDSTDA